MLNQLIRAFFAVFKAYYTSKYDLKTTMDSDGGV